MKAISILCVVALTACIGCGQPAASVQGTVTIDGQLARQGTVIFHPVEEGPVAYGSIAEDGSYALRVGQGDLSDANSGDVPVGEYIVTVVSTMPAEPDETQGKSAPPTPGARLSAEKYGTKETSDLRHTVKEGRNVVPLEVEGTSADEASKEGVEDEAETTDDAKAAEPADETAPPTAELAPSEATSDIKSTSPEEPPAASPPASDSDLPAAPSDAEARDTEATQ